MVIAPPPGFSFPNKEARAPTEAPAATGWGAPTFGAPAWGMTSAAVAAPPVPTAAAPAPAAVNPGRMLMGLLQKNNNNGGSSSNSSGQQAALPSAPPALLYGEPNTNHWAGGQRTVAAAAEATPATAMSHEQGVWSTIGAMMSSTSLAPHSFAPELAGRTGLQQPAAFGMQGVGMQLPSQAFPAFSSGAAAMWGGQDGLSHTLSTAHHQQQQHPANAAAPLLQMLQQSSGGSSGLTSASNIAAATAAASSASTLSLPMQPNSGNIPAGVLNAFGGSGGGAGKAADKPAVNLGHSIWASTSGVSTGPVGRLLTRFQILQV